MVPPRVLTATIVLIATAIVSPVRGGPRPGQRDDAKYRAEAQQREVKMRMEKAHREMEQQRRGPPGAKVGLSPEALAAAGRGLTPRGAPLPGLGTSAKTAPARRRPGGKANEPRYDLRDGTLLAYAFRLEMQEEEEHRGLAGIALFELDAKTPGKVRVRACDNLRSVSDLAQPLAFPTNSELIKSSFQLDADGIEPAVDGELPHYLGRPQDWFFPPLPRGVDRPETGLYFVQRGPWLSQDREPDRQDRGLFRWTVQVVRSTPSHWELIDRRWFRTEDGSQEFEGNGQISFGGGRAGGQMVSRSFRGTHALHGVTTEIMLRVQQLPIDELRDVILPGE